MTRYARRLTVMALVVLCLAGVAKAVHPGDSLLPDTTVGYVSVPDVDALREKWNETQFGQMLQDPVMRPFVEDLEQQIKDRLLRTKVRLGLTWDDLEGVYGGEVCLAVVQPGHDVTQHALAVVVDVTGHQAEAEALLKKIGQNLMERGAKLSARQVGGIKRSEYTLPLKEGEATAQRAIFFIHQDQLVATDHDEVANGIQARFSGEHQDTLAHVESYRLARERYLAAVAGPSEGDSSVANGPAHIHWFVNPFGYAETIRAANGGRKKRGTDLLKVLSNQGFRSISGVGGQIVFSTGQHELLHKTMIVCPIADREGESALAARMLQFPNSNDLAPQTWIPGGLTNYLSFNWKMTSAFEYSKTLVNELVGAQPGEDIFEDVIQSIKHDKQGPQIDIRADLVAHFGERATLLTDNRLPVTTKSERLLFAIELTNPQIVAETVRKEMEHNRDAVPHKFEGHTIWEILDEDEEFEVEAIQIDAPGFGFGDVEQPVPEEEEGKLEIQNLAVTVCHNHLIVASHLDIVKDVVKQSEQGGTLSAAGDFTRVDDALAKLAPGQHSFKFFCRTDNAYRPTYELIRQGKMPQSESVLGKVLNRLLGPEEEGVLRDQEIDGTKMPEFSAIEKYLGPAGFSITTDDQGWIVSGCVLTKPTP